MIEQQIFTFNDFQENTYVLYDETGACVIIDPGCATSSEQEKLAGFIEQKGLRPDKLLNTHCHIDHVLGNAFVSDTYGLDLYMHKLEESVLRQAGVWGEQFGFKLQAFTGEKHFVDETDQITFGNSSLQILFTPGHSPGSITFIEPNQKFLIGGDVLFRQSIGRTDLPGGDYDTLIRSIKQELLVLDDDVKVYPGHGPMTTVGFERDFNPFLQQNGFS